MKVKWLPWPRLINKHFYPPLNNSDRYLILWGSRGSGKSDFVAKKLIYRCLTAKYFRYILIRNNYNSIKDSSYQTLKDIIEQYGLSDLFEFKLQPMEIICKNGNKFIARGCDDTTKLKSVKDPTGAWYEEDIPSEADFITITTSIRTQKADYLQEVFTINPEVEGNYEDNWFWQKFFKDRPEKNFSDKTVIKIGNDEVNITYTSHHSTYKNNKWLPNEFKAFLEDLKNKNPYYYTIYTLGEWGNKETGGLFYKDFYRGKHLTDQKYRDYLPLHISFDFNVRPYMTLTVWQIQGKTAVQVDEILGKEPKNSTQGVCSMFCVKYRAHNQGIFVYGDPAGRHQDTRTEAGANDFDIISRELRKYHPSFRVTDLAPNVVGRGGFINAIFRDNEQGIQILFNKDLSYTVMDYAYLKEAMDGNKFKEKVKDASGVPCEKYGHISDANDYLITIVFRQEFNKYLTGNREKTYLTADPRPTFNRL